MLESMSIMNRKDFKKNINLIKEIAITDFKLKYQGSVFGYLWSLVKPLAYFSVLYVIFTKVFHIGSDIPHYPIHLLVAVVLFSFWAEATSIAMNAIVSRGGLIRKIYFPRMVLVIAATLTSLITLSINMIVVIILALLSGVTFGPNILWLIPLTLELYLFVVGVSFYLSALYVKFRDIGHIWEVFNQVFFYATPIVYPLILVPFAYARFMVLSPLTQVIQDSRMVILNYDVLTPSSYWRFPLIPEIIVLVILITGYLLFQKMAAKFAEEI
jgi:ABC-2 type transport system permease protein